MHRPMSCTHFGINLVGLAVFMLVLYVLNSKTFDNVLYAVLILLLSYAVPIVLLEHLFLRRSRHDRTVYDFGRLGEVNWSRSLLKIIGLYLTIAWLAAIYWLFPEYHGDFYTSYWALIEIILPAVIISAPLYITLMDGISKDTHDGYLEVGLMACGKFKGRNIGILKQHFLGWLVKGFFLPLMVVYLSDNIDGLLNFSLEGVFSEYTRFYDFMWLVLFTVDLIVVCVGYLMTVKLTDSHIRSTEPTMLGWVVALACYQPFWSMISQNYINYDSDGIVWGMWLQDHPYLYVLWGSMILLLLVIYVLSTIAFGLRFSNLTHRGIITNGPYKYSKHPAYISKSLSWWLISIPFITEGPFYEAIRHMLLILLLNYIYYLRAKTEERHLSWDPVYRQYAKYIDKNGWLPRLRRLVLKRAD